jgi:hypothetical protein
VTLWLRSLARSARFVAPLAAFTFVVIGVYAYDDNPAFAAFATTAALLVPLAGWIGLALLDGGELSLLELAGLRRGHARVACERAAAGLLIVAAMAAAAVLYPRAIGAFEVEPTAGQLLQGWLAHVACGAVGLGFAACLSRGVGPLRRASLAAAAVLFGEVLLVPLGLPPMSLIGALSDDRAPSGPLLATLAVAAVLLAGSVVLSLRRSN